MAHKGPEVRIGLVLYGGVSLAVYIYGIVVEVQRLLRAAAELERGGEIESMSPYAQALGAAGASAVGVDLLSGTSAGGINGILLAKALARGADVESARDLWIEGGDIEQLLQPPSVADPRSLLQSKYFRNQLSKGMRLLDEPEKGALEPPPILDLFVSSTHLRGGQRLFVDSLKGEIPTLQYRYVFQLKLRTKRDGPEGAQGYEENEFVRNDRLVKLARATSAFPFAFEPVEITAKDELLAEGEPDAWFADGGILNNKPFTEAVETIVNRSSDRPVRRWLFSVDPDPDPPEGEPDGAGPMPPFDQTVVRSIAAIPRYQSIARDLLALEEHNEKVVAAEVAIYEGEAALAAEGADGRLGAGAAASYRAMRRQAWGIAVADRLMSAVRLRGAGKLDTAGVHRSFRIAAEETLRLTSDGSLRFPRDDAALHLRRLYYLIKLIGMAVDGSVDLAETKAVLWGEYEEISAALWDAFSRQPLELGAADQREEAYRLGQERIKAAAPALERAVLISSERLRSLEGIEAYIAPRPVPHPARELKRLPAVGVSLGEVFSRFGQRDEILIAAEVYGGLRQRDRIEHAQISPAAATSTGVSPKGRLAGATLGHFGGFLDRGWRANDLMWGRLDAAEILIRAILKDGPEDRAGPLTDALQQKIFEAERCELAGEPGTWKQKLKRYAEGDVSAGELNGRRLVSLGLRAASIVRRMLRTAAAEADSDSLIGSVRAFGLRTAANGLGFVLALVYLPSTALFTKGKFVRRGLTLLAFLPFLWGLATLILGILGVLEFSDVVGPAAAAIAVYPMFLLLYWGLSRLAWWLERRLSRLRLRRPERK